MSKTTMDSFENSQSGEQEHQQTQLLQYLRAGQLVWWTDAHIGRTGTGAGPGEAQTEGVGAEAGAGVEGIPASVLRTTPKGIEIVAQLGRGKSCELVVRAESLRLRTLFTWEDEAQAELATLTAQMTEAEAEEAIELELELEPGELTKSCPNCGSNTLEVYFSQFKGYSVKGCAECGLHEDQFYTALERKLITRQLVGELVRIEQALIKERIVNSPQDWTNYKQGQILAAIKAGSKAFGVGVEGR